MPRAQIRCGWCRRLFVGDPIVRDGEAQMTTDNARCVGCSGETTNRRYGQLFQRARFLRSLVYSENHSHLESHGKPSQRLPRRDTRAIPTN
jgi:hypothetical protein